MLKDTSLAAFWSERLNFRLQPKEAAIYDDLHIHGPATRADLVKRTGLKINCICGRVNHLLALGVIEEFEKVTDPETNKQVWKLRCKHEQPK